MNEEHTSIPPIDDGPESEPLLLARRSRRETSPDPVAALAQPERTRRKREPAHAPVHRASPRTRSARFGAAGLLVAALLVLLSAFADLVASDLPIACRIHDKTYVLPNIMRPAELEAMDRDVLARDAVWTVGAVVAHGPRLAPGATRAPLLSPSAAHLFGTDREGRDVFARTVHGTRSYLVFALAAVIASVVFGIVLGAVAGLFGGTADALLSRAVESVSAFPPLVLVIGIQAAVPRPTRLTLFFAIALTRWPEIARLVRGEVLAARTRDYALAARALGASPFRVLWRHLMPNVRGPLVVAAAAGVGAVVLTEASLDFLRVGTPGGAASWGETMSEFRDAPGAWWLLTFPGVLLVVTIVASNLMGEALRSALDPRAR